MWSIKSYRQACNFPATLGESFCQGVTSLFVIIHLNSYRSRWFITCHKNHSIESIKNFCNLASYFEFCLNWGHIIMRAIKVMQKRCQFGIKSSHYIPAWNEWDSISMSCIRVRIRIFKSEIVIIVDLYLTIF